MPTRQNTYKPNSCATILLNLFKRVHSVQCQMNESQNILNMLIWYQNYQTMSLWGMKRCCWRQHLLTVWIIINPLWYNTKSSIYFSLHTVYKGIIFGNALTLFSILKSRYKSWKKKVLIIIVKTPTLFGDKVEKEQFIFVSSPSFKFISWHLWNKNNVYEEKN